VLQLVGAYCPSISSIGLEKCPQITDLGINCLAEGCPKIQELCVTEVRKKI